MSSGKVYALIQARMSSSRFPGKVIQELDSKPMILFQIHRVLKSSLVDDVYVLTSTDNSDDRLCKILLENDIKIFRGSLLNVNERYLEFLKSHTQCKVFVRLTADCPLSCSDIINEAIAILKEYNLDYVSNTLLPTFPDGTDVEVVSSDAFISLEKWSLTEYQKEHVTPFIYQNPNKFKLGNIFNRQNFSMYRCTIDTRLDFLAVAKLLSVNPKLSFETDFMSLKTALLSPNNPFHE
jgi:spore coat polysaccharide biosynthesis protein SpsF